MPDFRFQNGRYYHIYNRGVDKREVFSDEKDYLRFLRSMREFNNNLGDVQRDYIKRAGPKPDFGRLDPKSDFGYPKSDFKPLVEFICFCLNPNHYHFLLKQLKKNGITDFMRKLGTGYTNYFNTKHKRSGSLFQGKYKCVPVKTDRQWLYVSAYINGNAEIHGIAKAEKWFFSSYSDYLGKRNGTLCRKQAILKEFASINDYRDYVNEVIVKSGEIKEEMKSCLLE
jgi:putative transposase